MRRLAGFLLGLGVLTAVGCRSSPCEPSLWDRLFNRQPTMMMMGDPCACPCNKPMGMEMAYEGGPVFSAPPGTMAGQAPPGGVRGDITSQPRQLPNKDKGFANPTPWVPDKDGK